MSGRDEIFQQAMNQGHNAAWDQAWDKAAGYYRQALEEFPNHPSALTSLGLALYELGQFDTSLHFYMQAVRATPQDPLPVEKISQIYDRLGNIERAGAAAYQAAELYLKNRDVNKAIENWTRATHLQPENQKAHSRLAMVFERLGRKNEAVIEYLALAGLHQHAKEREKALRAVNQALQISPGNIQAMDAMTMLRQNEPLPLPRYSRTTEPSTGLGSEWQLSAPKTETQTGKKQDPVAATTQKSLAVLAGMMFETAVEDGQEASNRRGFQALMRGSSGTSRSADRTRVQLHISQVVELQTQQNYAQALDELERAIDAGLDHPAAYFDLALLQARTGQVEDAQRNLQYAVQNPEFALGARLLLGQILQSKSRLREAAVAYMQALSLADASLLPNDEAEELRQLYEPLIEAQNQETDTAALRQVCDNIVGLLMQADWRENLEQARKQLSVPEEGGSPLPLAEVLTQSRSSQIVESLSRIHQLERKGHLRSAVEEAYHALEFAPTYLPLHAHMAELLLKQGQLNEGLSKLLVVAQSYSMRGESRRAIQMYRRVIELAPMDLTPRLRLIDQLVAMGQIEDALNEYMDSAEAYYNLADLEKARLTYNEAMKLAQQSKVDRSWQVRILHRMADIDQQSLDWRQALRIHEQIRNLQPDDEKARTSLVELNSRLGQEARAMAELDNYLIHLRNLGQLEKGLNFLEGLNQEDPSRLWVRRRLAEFYGVLGRASEAIQIWDALGDKLVENGDISGAIQAVEAILVLRPPNAAQYQQLLAQLRSRV